MMMLRKSQMICLFDLQRICALRDNFDEYLNMWLENGTTILSSLAVGDANSKDSF